MIKIYLKEHHIDYGSLSMDFYELDGYPKLVEEVQNWLDDNILEYEFKTEQKIDPLFYVRRGFSKFQYIKTIWYLEFPNANEAMLFKLRWL